MKTAARVSWAVTFVLGSVGLLFVPIVALPFFPVWGAGFFVWSRRFRDSAWAVILPPTLLLLYPVVYLLAPEPFFGNWNFFDPNPAPVPLHTLTPLELLSYGDPYWAGIALPVVILATPLLLCVAVWIAVRLRIES